MPYPGDIPGQRVRTDLPGHGTAAALIPGLLPGVPAYTVKVNAKFPAATPALRGVICLHSLQDGELLALLDSAAVTAWPPTPSPPPRPPPSGFHRRGRAGRDHLDRAAAPAHLARVVSTDHDPGRVIGWRLDTAQQVADTADVVVLATWSRQPILGHARPGQHLTTLGADEPGKVELSRRLLETVGERQRDGLPALLGAVRAAGPAGRAAHRGRVRAGQPSHYSDPAAYLLTEDKWADQWVVFCRLVGKPADATQGLADAEDELHTALGELEATLAHGDGPVRLDGDGDLVISPLTAEDIPAEAKALKAELTEMLPFAPTVSLLIEMDKHTGFLDCFTHVGGKQARTPELKRNLIAVLLAQSTNLGLTRMADACGISYDILVWTAEWYMREETLRAANLALIGYHQRLPLTPVFGTGTLSSSDGQRFPTRGKSVTTRALSRYFAHEGLSTYTHVTDQHTTYGTKIIVATKREAHYVLDEILGNATDIPITEHATDTHGVTRVNFGLFDLPGLQLSPRIQDLGKITLYRTGPKAAAESAFPLTGPLLTRKLNTDLIAEHWDDLLRLAGSLKFGHATASLLVGKLSASGRQNALAAALKEYGALRRTVYAAQYLADPAYRRKISRQLNKGESLHALKRDLLYAHEGMVRARHIEGQTEQAWCLTLVTNAVVTWTTEYYGLAVEQMRAAGRRIDDEVMAHISPAHSENINFFGAIEVDIDGELAQLGPTGYRPLRVRDTLF